jgi:hypothetical protein
VVFALLALSKKIHTRLVDVSIYRERDLRTQSAPVAGEAP